MSNTIEPLSASIDEQKLLGVIYLDSRVATGIFKEPELEILEAFAAVASVTVYNTTIVS